MQKNVWKNWSRDGVKDKWKGRDRNRRRAPKNERNNYGKKRENEWEEDRKWKKAMHEEITVVTIVISKPFSVDPRKLHALKWPSLSSFHSTKFYQFSSVTQIHYSRFLRFGLQFSVFSLLKLFFSHQNAKCFYVSGSMCTHESFDRHTHTPKVGWSFYGAHIDGYRQEIYSSFHYKSIKIFFSPLHMVNRALMWNS